MKKADTNMINEKYFSACRRLSFIMLGISIFFLMVFQAMSFFVAVDGGYEESFALALSIVPILGPFYCILQLFSSGTGEPIILIVLFIPFFTTFIGFFYFRRQYKRSLDELTDNTDPAPWDDNLVDSIDLRELTADRPPIDAGPVLKPGADEQIQRTQQDIIKPEPAKDDAADIGIEDRIDFDSIFEKYEIPDIAEEHRHEKLKDTRFDSEYGELLSDVLSILNKNKKV